MRFANAIGNRLMDMDEGYTQFIKNQLIGKMPNAISVPLAALDGRTGFNMPERERQRLLAESGNWDAAERQEFLNDQPMTRVAQSMRYAVPATGVTAAGIGVNAMMNNGTEEQAPKIDVSSIAPQRMFGGANGSPEGELVMAAIRGYGPYPELEALGLNTPEALEGRRQEILTMMEAEDERRQVIA